MIYNRAKKAFNSMPVDIEVVFQKPLGILTQTRFVKDTRRFCDFTGLEYNQILSYTNVRW
jgi:hypothetical protein